MTESKIASLPMYDWPELRGATNAFWEAIRLRLDANGSPAAKYLSWGGRDAAHWTASDLLLGQTCGYPLATSLKSKVRYVATPVYSSNGCEGPKYSSAIIVKSDSYLELTTLAKSTFAYNSKSSLSGYRAVRPMFGGPKAFFAKTIKSGGHRNSARMVADGRAEVAAIDAVCWDMLQKFEVETTQKLRVIGWTSKQPSLPMITSLSTSDKTVTLLREILKTVSNMPEAHALGITDFVEVPISDYHALSLL